MKKNPAKKYEKESGKKPIVATLAAESALRRQSWMRYGCNAFNNPRPRSAPMSFWTEQDVLQYIYDNKLKIASVYGDVIKTDKGFITTGEQRTGCIFCMFGQHLDKKENHFERLKKTHPQLWHYCMKPMEEGGLGLKAVCEYCHIRTGDEKKLQMQIEEIK